MATSTQVVTSAIPAGFEPFYKTGLTAAEAKAAGAGDKAIAGLIPQAFALYGKGTPADYQAMYAPLKAAQLYTGEQRIAGLSESQKELGRQLDLMETPGQFGLGSTAIGSGIASLTGLPTMGDKDALKNYMSPYTQEVIDVAKREALTDAQKAQLGANLGAARQGTYGGARQLLAQTERERALQQQLGDLQARGLQAAFESAQKGLESERAAQLQQAQTYGTLGQQFGQLGVAQQAADIDRLKTLGAYGDLERAIAQQQKDINYQNVMQQIVFPEEQINKLSGFIRGIPMTDQTTTTTTPPPSFASQLAGLGLSGLGIYNMLNPSK